jgi:hypothetical protein
MHQEFFHYAVPFTFGQPARRDYAPTDLHSGSCAVVQIGQSQFVVSARHVVEPAVDAMGRGADCLIGDVKVNPSVVWISDEDEDVATMAISGAEVRALEGEGYFIVRPEVWPPPGLALEDPILLAGFPAKWRRRLSWDVLDFPGATTLGLVHVLRDREFVFVDREVADHGNLPEDELAGMSGGPALLVRQQGAIVSATLCGVLKQGHALGDNRLLYFARLGRIGTDGSMEEAGPGPVM